MTDINVSRSQTQADPPVDPPAARGEGEIVGEDHATTEDVAEEHDDINVDDFEVDVNRYAPQVKLKSTKPCWI